MHPDLPPPSSMVSSGKPISIGNKYSTKRTKETIKTIQEKCENVFPVGMPTGPWPNYDVASEALNHWSRNESKSPFYFVRNTTTKATENCGLRQIFTCCFKGKVIKEKSNKCDCPFQLHLEDIQGGIIVSHMGKKCLKTFKTIGSWHGNSHSTDTLGKAHLVSRFREVPDLFDDEINILMSVNTPCNVVTHYLSRKCRDINIQVIINYYDVYNKYFRGRNGVDSNEDVMKLLNFRLSKIAKNCKFCQNHL